MRIQMRTFRKRDRRGHRCRTTCLHPYHPPNERNPKRKRRRIKRNQRLHRIQGADPTRSTIPLPLPQPRRNLHETKASIMRTTAGKINPLFSSSVCRKGRIPLGLILHQKAAMDPPHHGARLRSINPLEGRKSTREN